MRRLAPLSTILVALALPAHAQTSRTTPDLTGPTVGATAAPGTSASPNGNVSATGRKMPPTTGRMPAAAASDPKAAGSKAADTRVPDAKAKAVTEAEMLKAQKAAEARNKSWDARMRKTMGSICSGC